MIAAPGFAIIEPVEEEATLSVVSTDDKPVQKGKIIEIGPGIYSNEAQGVISCPFDKGDIVFHAYHYETLKVDQKEYRVVAFKDILVKL